MTEGFSYIVFDDIPLEGFGDAEPPTTERQDAWHFRTRPMRNGRWFGEARRGPFKTDHALSEPIEDDVWFEFAPSKDEVIAKLKAEVWS